MENILCTAEDLKRSEKLHQALEAAGRERSRLLIPRDKLQAECEDARARLLGAKASPGTSASRTDFLAAECERLETARDLATAAAEVPYAKALSELKAHDGRFNSAAAGWLGSIARTFDFDTGLQQFVRQVHQELDQHLQKCAPLSETLRVFNAARDRIESWKLEAPPSDGWVTSRVCPRTLVIPRLSDWLTPAR